MHFLEIPVFLGWFLRILWSKVAKNDGVSKICVFLHVQIFVLWVSFLAGVLKWNGCVEFHSLLLLERCEIHVKNIHNLRTLGNFEACS